MLRTQQRRHERRAVLRTRVFAAGTALLLALGVAVGGGVAAVAAGATTNTNAAAYWQQLPGEVCVKPAFSSENSTTTPYTLPALSAGSAYSKVIVKAGSTGNSVVNENSVYTTDRTGGTLTAGDTFVHLEKNSISHVIYCYVPSVPSAGNELDCVTAVNYPGRALTNGDHINMDIVQGGQKFQVNASVDIRQAQDPASESGLVLRVNAPGGPYTLPVTNDQKNSGILSFSYAAYLTGSFTVEWVQFNSTYFNQDRDEAEFLVCGDLPTDELVTPTARMVDLGCDTAGSYTLDDVEGIRWFIGDDEVQPGRYAVTTASTVVVRAEAIGPDYGLEDGAQSKWTFTFTNPTDCVPPPCIPDEFITYTYNNTNNTGVVTVTQPAGYDDQLCKPLYVTAAAWAFDKVDNVWTQTLVVANRINGGVPITEVGTYPYGAPVGCGQGDIYASRTDFPRPSPLLLAPNKPAWPVGVTPWTFTEKFLHSMGFVGPNPTYMQTRPGCNALEPVAPTVTAIDECGEYGSIVLATGDPNVSYLVKGADGTVIPAEEATEGTYTVMAIAAFPYILKNYPVGGWSVDLKTAYDCPVTPAATPAPENCLLGNGSIYFEPVAGIASYAVVGREGTFAPGETLSNLDAGTYTITAVPQAGYELVDGTTPFEVTVESTSVDCALATATVVEDPASCFSGSTLNESKFTVSDGVTWQVVDAGETSGSFEVVFLAPAGALFDNGLPRITISGELDPVLPDEDCVFPVTNVLLAFTAPTCELGQTLNVDGFVLDDGLAELAGAPVVGEDGSYTVVFTAIGDKTTFDQSPDVALPGRVVSNDGTTLTFTGTLLGPDRSDKCVTTVELRDPVSYVDSCLEGASFTITYVEGILYTVFLNDDEPFEVVWNDGEKTRTYDVEQGDTVRVIPSPASDRYTISPDPAPFERTFQVYEGDCLPTLPLTEASASFTPASCVDPTNWVVLERIDGVQWWVDGEPVEASRWAMPVGDVVVTATPEQGFGFPLEAQTRWEFTGVAIDPECLPTLAFTGATSALAGLGGLSLLLLLVGFGVMAVRRQQS